MIEVKICGVKTAPVFEAALEGGADYIGLMCYQQSPRYLAPAEARALGALAMGAAKIVAVVVNADNGWLDQIMRDVDPDFIQAHGEESPARIAEIKQSYRRPIIKAIAISRAQDIATAQCYTAADIILFDAKSDQRGGVGQCFDWRLLGGQQLPQRWMLAGGLNIHNLSTAIKASGASCVDVSSGVEVARGCKTPDLVKAFLKKAKSL